MKKTVFKKRLILTKETLVNLQAAVDTTTYCSLDSCHPCPGSNLGTCPTDTRQINN